MPLQRTHNPRLAQSVWWNLFLITLGSAIYALGIQAVAVPHEFLSGGIMGVAMLVWYELHWLTVPVWYFILCIPISILGWFIVGRVFLLYSMYGILSTSLFGYLFTFKFPIQNELYAAVLAGILTGFGSGIMLRSLGSGGGTDIIAVALRERWNISVGMFSFSFNACLFLTGIFTVSLDRIIVSTIMIFISAYVLEYVLSLFSRRKLVFIISDHGEIICESIMMLHKFGATLLRGKGGYLGNDREILLTVTSNTALKELENIVFNIDPNALFVVENTFYVSGGQFSRKIYK